MSADQSKTAVFGEVQSCHQTVASSSPHLVRVFGSTLPLIGATTLELLHPKRDHNILSSHIKKKNPHAHTYIKMLDLEIIPERSLRCENCWEFVLGKY